MATPPLNQDTLAGSKSGRIRGSPVACTFTMVMVSCLFLQLLQNIGNLSTEMDAKEAFMNPMAHLLPLGVKRVKIFIQDLVQIDQRDGWCFLPLHVTVM